MPLQVHYYTEALLTTAIQLCRSLYTEALQATVSEGLAQGLYMAARAEFEPTTLRSKGIDSTNAPPRLTKNKHLTNYIWCSIIFDKINIKANTMLKAVRNG